ncbi:dialkylrecorsinol condensing enzyme [Ferribacterium limneticum]|uniref:dialkylrecorsinol condensing enzyme n=1 Tax=Ferribacterium limneticum TaxID=76259 RepID=UPI001CFA6E36|nr:dialkylrecorsinol condensing enzyme [Ferribacterium limneticum]UCV30343.1 dialkylresorcinol condensing enzyme [Ferribacterium limneticum]UCV34261.1 dialkylresorcinol condensing enzyme [Ferribacterium limneticum]
MKRVLVVNFSQTGQLSDITAQLIGPLRDAGNEVHLETLQPENPFPFPWPIIDFVDAMPECVQLDAPPLKALGIPPATDFDLVILSYQVWFLSPGLPMTAFLKSQEGQRLLNGKPVVTLVACRNMWLSAQETMQRLIVEAGGQLRDHIAFTDRGHPLATFITTPRWVLTGKRDRFLGMPPAGVAPEEIDAASRFGRALADALSKGEETTGRAMLTGLRAVTVNPRLAISERAGRRAFGVWSKLIRAFGKRGQWQRRPALLVFSIYLITMVLTVVPTSLLLQWLFSPLLKPRLDRLRAQLEQPSGSQEFNLQKYDQ